MTFSVRLLRQRILRPRFHKNRRRTVTINNLKFLPTLDAFPNVTITELGGLNVGPDPNGPWWQCRTYNGRLSTM